MFAHFRVGAALITTLLLVSSCASAPRSADRNPAQLPAIGTPVQVKGLPGEVGNTGTLSGRTKRARVFKHVDLKVEATADSLSGATQLGRMNFTVFFSTDGVHCVINLPNNQELSCKTKESENAGRFVQVEPAEVIQLYKAILGSAQEALADRYFFKQPLILAFTDSANRVYQAEGVHGEGATNLRFLGSGNVRNN